MLASVWNARLATQQNSVLSINGLGMITHIDSDELLKKYLLGELREEQRATLEERYFNDSEIYDRLLVAEDELIDSYVRGALSNSQRDHFENYFLRSADRRDRVEFARSLTAFVSEGSPVGATALPSTSSSIGPATSGLRRLKPRLVMSAAAILLLLLSGIAFFLETKKLREDIRRAEADREELERQREDLERRLETERARGNEIAAELDNARSQGNANRSSSQPNAQTFLLFVLRPSGSRGPGALQTLEIGSGLEWVSLELQFKGREYERYDAILKTATGSEVRSITALTVRSAGSTKTAVWKLAAERGRLGARRRRPG